jgi:hypothetical protein
MKTFVLFLKSGLIAAAFFLFFTQLNAQNSTEFIFRNPVLVSGLADQDGAVYLFKNVAPGVDATVTVIGRSAPTVILDTIDIAPGGGMGYDKALQPQLGMHGTVPANSSWWMKFQVNFLQAGKKKSAAINNFVASAIDVDGDNLSIAENIEMFQTNGVTTSISSVLTSPPALTVKCPKDGKLSLSIDCPGCLGQGYIVKPGGKIQNCGACNNTGKLFAACNHAWIGSDIQVSGTSFNAIGIDTLAINNMATFSYSNTDQVIFTYGGTTGAAASSAGARLNSLWFKSFDYSVSDLLPLKLESFSAAARAGSVDLKWTASNQINFNHFELERSSDGKSFTTYAIIFPAENAVSTANYDYTDKHPDNSTQFVYYRLKMVDVSGKMTYSQAQIIRLEDDKNAIALVAYPNPAVDQLRLSIPAGWQGNKAVAQIYTAAGIMVKSVQFPTVANTEQLDVTQLSKGLYVVNITCQNKTLQAKILKN